MNRPWGLSHRELHLIESLRKRPRFVDSLQVVYCAMKLNLPRRSKRRLAVRLRQPLSVGAAVNEVWSLDFMKRLPLLYDGRRFRTLNVLDEGVR